jgi:hypothetical protein
VLGALSVALTCIRSSLFCLKADAEEVEEDLENSEGGHGEDHTEDPCYLTSSYDAQEDGYRGHIQDSSLYGGLQEVAFDLLYHQVEDCGQQRLGGRDGEGNDDRGYRSSPSLRMPQRTARSVHFAPLSGRLFPRSCALFSHCCYSSKLSERSA